MWIGLRSWFRNLLRRPAVEASLDEELRACVDILAANKIRAGVAPAEARRQALLEIGGVDVVKERVRDVRRASTIEALARDLRHAVRILRKQPLLTCAVVLTLAIGIGSPASAFSLLNHFIFAPPPNPDPEAFFRVSKKTARGHDIAIGIDEYVALRDRAQSARQVAAWSIWMMRAPLGTDDPSLMIGSLVSCNLLSLFRVDVPVAGRLLTTSDCEQDLPVAVLNERTWRSRFGSDPSVLGTTMRYGGSQVTIVGVAAAPSLRRQWDDADELVDLFVPYSAYRQLKAVAEFLGSGHGWLHVGGLLQPGVSRDAAGAEFLSIDLAAAPLQSGESRTIVLTDGSRWAEAPGEMLGILAMALALPALILFMSCVNVSALLLSRSVSRRQEMAVRLALGTSKRALVRMLLTESALMAGLAAGIGLAFVYGLPPLIVTFFDAETWLGSAGALTPDWRVVTALCVGGVVAALLAGLTPALAAFNPRPVESLKGRPDSELGGTSRTRRWLVGLQVAASMIPLVVAIAFWSAVTRVGDPGFQTSDVLVAPVPQQKPRDISLGVVASELSAAPGVEAVAYEDKVPLRFESSARIKVPGSDVIIEPAMTSVSRNYFDLLGISIVAGRSFERQDEAAGANEKPVVISSQLAVRLFGAGRGPGERIDAQISAKKTEPWLVVGIARDRLIGPTMSRRTLTDGSMVYQLLPESSKAGVLLVKTAGAADAMTSSVRDRLRAALGSATTVRTLGDTLADLVAGVRKLSIIMLILGVLAFGLAIVGVVGTVSFDARQRRKEFAIRCALGAGPWAVRRRVIQSGLRPIVPAILVGLIGSWGALTIVDSERLSPFRSIATAPAPYAAITFLLIVSVLATLVAIAYPAGRRDPLMALREE
jgi:predicted permease